MRRAEQSGEPGQLFHVLNGDATREKLERSDVPGTLGVWAEVLHDGPVLADLPPDRWREMRARTLASSGFITREEALASLTRQDAMLERFRDFQEVVLWFEHDLYDQLLLVRHLDWFAAREIGDTRLSLICIDSYPGVADFRGLGQLTPGQLASLLADREPVGRREFELGRAAWRAFTSPDPTAIERLLQADSSALPFLAAAFRRHLQEFPWTRDGLPRTERQILRAIAHGATSPPEAFSATQTMEERVYMGDWSFWWRVQELARGTRPLVELDVEKAEKRLPPGHIRLTDTGRAVLQGAADWVKLNGIDRWLGGVHLEGGGSDWRWDDDAERLVG